MLADTYNRKSGDVKQWNELVESQLNTEAHAYEDEIKTYTWTVQSKKGSKERKTSRVVWVVSCCLQKMLPSLHVSVVLLVPLFTYDSIVF